MNILFYGNCQTDVISKTLNLPNDNVFSIYCFSTDISKENFTSIIEKCDIIITQSIQDNYRDVSYLSTSYIIQNSKKNCKIIIFDSCYFNFYYFDCFHKIQYNYAYHYKKMFEYYENGYSEENYVDNCVNNLELKTSDELEIIVEKSINELKLRSEYYKNTYKGDNIYYITTNEFIKNNYKDKLLFYTPNHPSKYLIQFICEEILKLLEIQDLNVINYNIDLLENSYRCILYKCIQKNVNFDITKHLPKLTGPPIDNYTVVKMYYDAYNKIEK